MQFFQFKKKDVLSLALTMALASVVCLLFLFTNILDRFELSSVDFRFYLRKSAETRRSKKIGESAAFIQGNKRANEDIIIISIDEETIGEFDKVGVYWPFPWEVHAQVCDFLSTGKPNTILFDIMFLEHKSGEITLAESFANAANVIVDYPFEKTIIQKRLADIDERSALLKQRNTMPSKPEYTIDNHIQELIPPTPDIIRSVKWTGFANVEVDSDNVLRRVPLVLEYEGRYYISVVLAAALNYYNIGLDSIEVVPGKHIKLKNIAPEKLVKKYADGTITIPIDEHGMMDTNFIGGPGTFNSVPYYYFCRGVEEGPIQGFENKIAMVAAYASKGIADDMKETPFGQMFGIEHMANSLNTIINQDFLYRPTNRQVIALMFAIALFAGLLLSRMNIVLSSIVTAAGATFYFYLSNFYLFEEKNYIIPFVPPFLLIILCFIGVTVIRVLTEQSEKQIIRKTFSRFVSKSVVDELLKDPKKVKLGGEKKIITVLFSDIRGFTTISEGMPPEQLVDLLNEYLEAMTEIVIKYNGTLDKYIGDAIMAFWGAPIPQEDHALLCCKAAVDMISSLNKLNEKWKGEGKAPLKIGIGINSGDMVVANMGSSSRMDYTLIGDEVNTGSRLEGTNKVYGTEIIISDKTYAMVKDHVIVRELDYVRVKGKKHPVYLYELLDMV